MNIEELYQHYLASRAVSTDSRLITPGCLFFAFKGDNFDGNAFVPSALEQGASVCVTTDPRMGDNPRCMVVTDTLQTLQRLAALHRGHISIPVIGITGTNGKTTTKELVSAVLRCRYKVHATEGNHNNHIGVPLTLLSIPADCEIAVVEMGANHPGEIAALCEIAQPDHGLITSVGKAHLEGFGSFQGVVHTKTELYRYLDSHAGTIFVNSDNKTLADESRKVPHATIITYGSGEEADTTAHFISADPYLTFYTEAGAGVYSVKTHLFGSYNFANAAAALAVGRHFKIDPYEIKQALEQYIPDNNRSQIKQTSRNKLLLDCYNANPTSMEAALHSFADIEATHRVVILGAMKELGRESAAEHRRILELALSLPFEQILLVGQEFDFAAPLPRVQWFADSQSAKLALQSEPLSGCTILLKGSNSTRMWQLEEVL